MAGKIIVLKGLPGCGKSTRAKAILDSDKKAIRLNKDTIREMFHFGGYHGRNERYAVELEYSLAEKFLSKDMTVVVDDTNLNPTHPSYYKSLAEEHGAQYEEVSIDTPIEECIKRDQGRKERGERFVGRENIINMAYQFGYLKHDKPCAIFDLDGTLCDLAHRRPLVRADEARRQEAGENFKPNWDAFFAASVNDQPRPEVIQKTHDHHAQGHEVIIVSACPEDYREQREKWLKDNNVYYDRFIMRKHKDYRQDTIVKKEILDKYLAKEQIVKVYDDRPSVIRMWRDNGLDVEDVGNGEEF